MALTKSRTSNLLLPRPFFENLLALSEGEAWTLPAVALQAAVTAVSGLVYIEFCAAMKLTIDNNNRKNNCHDNEYG